MSQSTIDLEIIDDIAIVTMNMPNSSANVLTPELFRDLDHTFDQLIDRDDLAGVVLRSAKGRIFLAGADLKGIWKHLNWPDERIVQFCEEGRRVMRKLSQMKAPTCAAIHGACVGGGLELTLWCDYRIAMTGNTRLGLPEVRLGLVPGWAGTVRLSRIANLETGLDLVTSARLVDAESAHEMGFIDAIVTDGELQTHAIEWLKSNQDRDAVQQRRERALGPVRETGDRQALEQRFLEAIHANRAIHPDAPTKALRHMLDTADVDHDTACASESRLMAEVWGSAANRGLLSVFFLDEFVRKNPGPVDQDLVQNTPSPKKIGIIGAGTMGQGIARACLDAGLDVTIHDSNPDALRRVVESAAGHAVKLKSAESLDDFSDRELVIETVSELFDVKCRLLAELETKIHRDAVIATNTSALTLQRLGTALKHDDRFCGIHFCHPQLLELIEVVQGERTRPSTVASSIQFVRTLRKTPVIVKDSPGFVLNRLLTVYLDRAFQLVARGNSFSEIDQVMRDFGFLAGPFEVVDLIGADVCLLASRAVWFVGMRHINPTPLMPRMVKQGWLGRKTGRGFYIYDAPATASPANEREPNPDIVALAQRYRQRNEPVAKEQIADHILAPMAQEALRELDEELVADFRHIDVCILKGLGFPAHHGGILFWGDQTGWSRVADLLQRSWPDEPRLQPCPRLLELAGQGKTLYPQPDPPESA